MLTTTQIIIIILVTAVATVITRFLPFLIFSGSKEHPYINYLGSALPFAAIGLLVVYCLKGVDVTSSPYGATEFIAIIFIGILHYWKENTLLSIGAGTILYMFLVQTVFI